MGQIIRRLRKERNLTQEELAEQLNISSPAISKWENDTSMPDISQVVPLANVFGVSTDVLFGVEGTNADSEAIEIIRKSDALMEYGNLSTYLAAYDTIIEALKKYPNNLILLNNCIGLGCSLALPENGWIYASERSNEITLETIRQANLIISYSKNMTDIMRAHEILVFLYSAEGKFDKAASEAQNFPERTDFTLYSNMATVTEHMKNYDCTAKYLCSDIDSSLQQFEYNTARLGKAYMGSEKYNDAIEVLETFFAVMKAIFKDECPPPYHDFDSGDCYILLAHAYLAIGEKDKAIDCVENSIMYYMNMIDNYKDDKIPWKALRKSSLVKESSVDAYICKTALKEKLLEKLSSAEIQSLSETMRFKALYDKVNSLDN